MNLPILLKSNDDIFGFINFWSRLYVYPLESKYNLRIHNKSYTNEDLQELFIWKNGMKLSEGKQKSFDAKILKKKETINQFKALSTIDLIEFKKEFSNLSAVWKIFLLHIIHPYKFPIYDQHINRAFNFIHGLDFLNISAESMTNREKEDFYFETYLPFITSLNSVNLKSLDEAFFTFGQFINTKKYVEFIL